MRYRCTWCMEYLDVLVIPDDLLGITFHYCADGRYGLIEALTQPDTVNPCQGKSMRLTDVPRS